MTMRKFRGFLPCSSTIGTRFILFVFTSDLFNSNVKLDFYAFCSKRVGQETRYYRYLEGHPFVFDPRSYRFYGAPSNVTADSFFIEVSL